MKIPVTSFHSLGDAYTNPAQPIHKSPSKAIDSFLKNDRRIGG